MVTPIWESSSNPLLPGASVLFLRNQEGFSYTIGPSWVSLALLPPELFTAARQRHPKRSAAVVLGPEAFVPLPC